MATLDDWKKEIAGQSDLDESEYMDFIPRDGNDAFLKDAFIDLPRGYILIARIKKLLEENNNSGLYVVPKKENFLTKHALLELTRSYCDNVSAFYDKLNMSEFAREAAQSDIEIVHTNNEFFEKIKNTDNVSSDIEDKLGKLFRKKAKELGSYTYALQEAALYLTKYPAITRYLLEDVVAFPLQHEPYYELWRGGGDVWFFKDRILMLCERE
ncbi:hypothetical protein [Phyllobacterium myrsinacearum]|uniref:Uncharacterized protein n=1 Tax=Phyllobacterium myrsinacearum TaxID=28101 RepID=A0A839EVC2_9HYPH|nr:hypothetical protein [Phyllobacterium myrsinacearum]MBA8882045.1 hypothetical protein [Phyllobacterium myrsinacearum]